MSDLFNFTEVHRALIKRYNLDELHTLCADLGVPYEEINAPRTLTGNARELIYWLNRRERLRDLEPFLGGTKIVYQNTGTLRPSAQGSVPEPSLDNSTEALTSDDANSEDAPAGSEAESVRNGLSDVVTETIKGETGQHISPVKASAVKPDGVKLVVTIVLGFILLGFFIWAFIYAPDQLPAFKQRILAIVSALLCGFFTFLLTGTVGLNSKSAQTPFGDLSLKATGGSAVFILVLIWWLTPFAPIPPVKDAVTDNPPSGDENSRPPSKAIVLTPLAPLVVRSKVNSVALDVTGERAVIAEEDGTVHVWQVRAGGQLRELSQTGKPAGARSVALRADGEMIAVGSSDGKVRLWRTSDAPLPEQISSHSSYVYEVYLSRDGRRLVTTGVDNDNTKSARLWNIGAKAELITTFKTPNLEEEILAVSPDLQTIALYSHRRRRIELWSITDRKLIGSLGESEFTGKGGGAFDEDGKLFAVGNDSGTVWLWQTSDGKRIKELNGLKERIVRIALHPTGQMVAAAFARGATYVWSTVDPNLYQSVKEHEQRIFSLTFSANGRMLASGGEDGKVQLWEVTSKV